MHRSGIQPRLDVPGLDIDDGPVVTSGAWLGLGRIEALTTSNISGAAEQVNKLGILVQKNRWLGTSKLKIKFNEI